MPVRNFLYKGWKIMYLVYTSIIVLIVKIIAQSSNYNQIMDHLYLGNFYSGIDKKFIQSKNITLVINCSHRLPFLKSIPVNIDNTIDYGTNNIEQTRSYRFAVNDIQNKTNTCIFKKQLPKVVEIIKKEIENGGNVLVHCKHGISRSATVIAYYTMKYLGLTRKQALKFVKSKRGCAFKFDYISNFYDALTLDNENIV